MQNVSVRRIPGNIAKPFIQRWHYSASCPTGKNIFFGWYLEEELYAVIDYGFGVNPQAANFFAKQTGLPVNKNNMLEITRLCRVEPKNDALPLTKFISICNKILAREGICFIVSYSDPTHGHSGGIYKAANFVHLGKTDPQQHCVDAEGNLHHRRYHYRYAKRKNISTSQARQELGLKLVWTLPKDRWFIQIGRCKRNKPV